MDLTITAAICHSVTIPFDFLRVQSIYGQKNYNLSQCYSGFGLAFVRFLTIYGGIHVLPPSNYENQLNFVFSALMTAAFTPLDHLLVKTQMNPDARFMPLLSSITQESLFMRGIWPNFIKQITFSFPMVQISLVANGRKKIDWSEFVKEIGTALTLAYPFENIRTRMQMSYLDKSAIECMRRVAEEEGFKGFYKGFWWFSMRNLMAFVGLFATCEAYGIQRD